MTHQPTFGVPCFIYKDGAVSAIPPIDEKPNGVALTFGEATDVLNRAFECETGAELLALISKLKGLA